MKDGRRALVNICGVAALLLRPGQVSWEPTLHGTIHPTQAVPALVTAKAGAGVIG